ncbi:MAG: HRDC domain-containing protein [Sinobacterium sp.]|nr:HRDC domain-containing protein [Sinobacterium sp.]
MFSIEGVTVIYVDTPALLIECVECLNKVGVIAVDSEFIRVSTFFPKLALLQIYDGAKIYLIDAPAITGKLGIGCDEFTRLWAGLVSVLSSNEVVKIFHACEEDLELLYYYYSVLPNAIFDTQLACGFIGLDYPMGYQKLVESMCDKHVEKGDSRSNWLQRPLTDSQLSYAAYDVVFLIDIYQILLAKLTAAHQYERFRLDCDAMVSSLSRRHFFDAYLKIKSHTKLSAVPLWRLQKLAAWREEVMRRSDIPRNHAATNEALMILAKQGSATVERLHRVEGLSGAAVKKYSSELEVLLMAEPEELELGFFKKKSGIDARYLSQQQKKVKARLQASAEAENISSQIMVKKPKLEAMVLQFEIGGDLSESQLDDILGDNWRREYYRSALDVLVS